MKINYDTIADALYFYLRKGKVTKTIPMTDRLLVDVDETGNIIGIEMLDASSQISRQGITDFEQNLKNGVPIEIVSATPAWA